MDSPGMKRVRRGSHWALGKYVIVNTRSWDGWTQRELWTESLFPINQSSHTMHPRHPTGYCVQTGAPASYAPSLSYYKDLCKYAGFRWVA